MPWIKATPKISGKFEVTIDSFRAKIESKLPQLCGEDLGQWAGEE